MPMRSPEVSTAPSRVAGVNGLVRLMSSWYSSAPNLEQPRPLAIPRPATGRMARPHWRRSHHLQFRRMSPVQDGKILGVDFDDGKICRRILPYLSCLEDPSIHERRKLWETRGQPKLLVTRAHRWGSRSALWGSFPTAGVHRFSIIRQRPRASSLGPLFGPIYARWRVNRIVNSLLCRDIMSSSPHRPRLRSEACSEERFV